jgi:hypothetical protein
MGQLQVHYLSAQILLQVPDVLLQLCNFLQGL